ncbi:MAG: methionine--tRNA ligase [Phycisphaerae bacterium]|nr:methionine--tRNA ligase [Phycisphaerae bacterium]
MSRKILVTAALPYANGSIHIGHLVEYLQTDMWVRFQKLRGNDCIYCCADDAHGTPIMIRARKEGITPEKLIADMHGQHARDFAGFGIEFDSYCTTNSDDNRQVAEYIFNSLNDGGHITTRDVKQAYCENDKMFLPDRFILGTCPKCGAEDQYGDTCEVCHGTYVPTELKNAKCSVCGEKPVERESKHYFVKLSNFEDRLQQWLSEGHVHEQVYNKLMEWFKTGLKDWDISRDGPYFGFNIPGEADKYFYVWFDAPIGYISSSMNYCKENGLNFEDYWKNPDAEIHHFIGKDITYFHALFWPTMLMGAGFNTPTQLAIHGFLTVNGTKMSKSKGTFISAETYLNNLDPTYLRYYYACKLSDGLEDIDLNLEDFVARVNSDLVGKIANLTSRSVQMLNKNFDSKAGALSDGARELLKPLQSASEEIAELFEKRQYAAAIRTICGLADSINRYVDERKPWAAVKEDAGHAIETLTATVNAVRIITTYLKPILPEYAAKIESILNIDPLKWDDSQNLIENHTIGKFQRLIERIDPKKVEAMVEESKQNQEVSEPKEQTELEKDPIAAECDFDDFMKVDLRVAKVLECEIIEEADKLLRFKLDLGGETRQVIAGIRKAYDPAKMIGRNVLMVANLKPRKMKFGMSEGMICAAGPGGEEVFVFSPDDGAKPGQRAH